MVRNFRLPNFSLVQQMTHSPRAHMSQQFTLILS